MATSYPFCVFLQSLPMLYFFYGIKCLPRLTYLRIFCSADTPRRRWVLFSHHRLPHAGRLKKSSDAVGSGESSGNTLTHTCLGCHSLIPYRWCITSCWLRNPSGGASGPCYRTEVSLDLPHPSFFGGTEQILLYTPCRHYALPSPYRSGGTRV